MKRLILGMLLFASFVSFAACGLLVDEGRTKVAKVGDEPIRLDDLLARIRTLPFEERAKTNDSNPAIRLEVRRSLLESLITEKLLTKEAKARNIPVSDAEALQVLQKNDESQPDVSEITEGVDSHEHSHEHQEHSASEIEESRLQLMVQKMLDSELNEASRRSYYETHPQEFTLFPPLVVCELLIAEPANAASVEKVRTKAWEEKTTLVEALGSIKGAPPVVFCGQLPPSPLNSLAPEVRARVGVLPDGGISELFHINANGSDKIIVARLVRHLNKKPYEEMRKAINKKLYEQFLQELRQKYQVVYYKDKLDYRLEG